MRSVQTVQNKNKNKRPQKGQVLTQHTGLPPRETGEKRPFGGKSKPKSKARG
ncbi:hypothetical protein, partial [Acinetobacter baumannii]|uniref:hypothetical protein n=1 Tax=Acinetobacter baumannii TaxID=470 RepID=UPI00148F03C2